MMEMIYNISFPNTVWEFAWIGVGFNLIPVAVFVLSLVGILEILHIFYYKEKSLTLNIINQIWRKK